ncbi:hypothetical protein GCM10027084_13570 [Pseudoxanthomonas sangjuensis]|uniref:hypothetical protein n=1 Tax=Pseudoxanthomonas sangjuensis TaxID=1503750 RepID=UPI00139107C7|nr:hypothetical protein [Pseudoxanthomonas sangjuensis]
MNAQQIAKDKLFGEAGLRASNFKLFPGRSRDATAEQVAQQIVGSIERIEKGELQVVEDFED